jgi:hypothetical protein
VASKTGARLANNAAVFGKGLQVSLGPELLE